MLVHIEIEYGAILLYVTTHIKKKKITVLNTS